MVVELEWRQKTPILPYSDFDIVHMQLAKINGIKDIGKFMHPTPRDLCDPYKMFNIEKARDCILKAIKNSEKISIFSDP